MYNGQVSNGISVEKLGNPKSDIISMQKNKAYPQKYP